MSGYTATAAREGRRWVIDVEGVDVTQSRTLAEAQIWAQGLASPDNVWPNCSTHERGW